MEIPKISLLTPIFNRHKFLNLMICNLSCFDYPRELITWEILDSRSKDNKKGKKLFENQNQINFLQEDLGIKIKYTYIDKPLQIGEKRNYLSKNADNKIMINLDSDDIFFPSYLKCSVMNLKQKKVGLTGSNQMLFFDVKNDKYKRIFSDCAPMPGKYEHMTFTEDACNSIKVGVEKRCARYVAKARQNTMNVSTSDTSTVSADVPF